MGLLRLKVNGEYVTVAQGPAGPIGPQGPPGPEIDALTTAARDALVAPDLYEGKVIYNSDLDRYQGYVGGSWGDFITSTGGVMTGRLITKAIRETRHTLTTLVANSTVTIDPFNGTIQYLNAANFNITFVMPFESGDSVTLRLNSPGAVTWPSSIKWVGGTAPTLVAGKNNLLTFFAEGTTYIIGSYVGEVPS